MRRSLVLMLVLFVVSACSSGSDWRDASREPAGIAPDPATTREAVLQVYGADAWGWRGWFAIHTWVAAKRTGEDAYTVYDVVGWRAYRGTSVVRIARDAPDRHWYGARPQLIREHRGEGVDALIDAVDRGRTRVSVVTGSTGRFRVPTAIPSWPGSDGRFRSSASNSPLPPSAADTPRPIEMCLVSSVFAGKFFEPAMSDAFRLGLRPLPSEAASFPRPVQERQPSSRGSIILPLRPRSLQGGRARQKKPAFRERGL